MYYFISVLLFWHSLEKAWASNLRLLFSCYTVRMLQLFDETHTTAKINIGTQYNIIYIYIVSRDIKYLCRIHIINVIIAIVNIQKYFTRLWYIYTLSSTPSGVRNFKQKKPVQVFCMGVLKCYSINGSKTSAVTWSKIIFRVIFFFILILLKRKIMQNYQLFAIFLGYI